jgi:hypothetical protein
MNDPVYKGKNGISFVPINDIEDNIIPFFIIAGYACTFE